MNRITAKTKIVIGLVSLLVSVLLAASGLGLMPDDREGIMRQRAAYCEAVSISISGLLKDNDTTAAASLLQRGSERNSDLLSASIRRVDADAPSSKSAAETPQSTDSHMTVPIRANDKPYGYIEFRFKPYVQRGILGQLLGWRLVLMLFVAGVSFIAFQLYMRKMLQHLDPSKVVPQRVRSALDNLVGSLFVLDLHERIVLANLAFGERLGKSVDALIGCRVCKLPWTAVDQQAAVDFPWTRVLRDNAILSNVQLQLECVDGITRTFIANCSPVLNHDGKARGVLVSLEDITELQKKEVELRASRDDAEKANHAKSAFLALMSHEIRTPLNAILGFADVLRCGYVDSEQEKNEYLNTIHSSGQHLLTLINDILDLSKVEAGKLELDRRPCSPHTLIRQVVAELSVRAKEKCITLEYEGQERLPAQITTDPNRLRQMLTNLAGNAIKFTHAGGVTMRAKIVQQKGKNLLSIDVIDTGIGMSPATLGKIFQPFVQADSSTSRNYGGTGLGLSICRRLANALGGSATVTSEEGRGSVFTLTIDAGDIAGVPLVTADEQSEKADETAKPQFYFAPSRVLVVDDGESNCKLVQILLSRAGLVVETASDGAQALERCRSQPFDLVLMDMNMPVMNGFDATRQLRDEGAKMPILAMTADAMKGSEDRCTAAGCSGLVTKPIQTNDLMATVAKFLPASDLVEGTGTAKVSQGVVTPQPASSQSGPIVSKLPMDDPEFREIVDEFITRLQQQAGAMQDAWKSRDLKQLAAIAHWLKGSGGTAGLDAFTRPAAAVEKLANNEELNGIQQAITEIQELVDRVERPRQDTGKPTPTGRSK